MAAEPIDLHALLRDGLPGVTAVALLPDGSLLASQTWENHLVTISIDETVRP